VGVLKRGGRFWCREELMAEIIERFFIVRFAADDRIGFEPENIPSI
jgi:hypothetical protein